MTTGKPWNFHAEADAALSALPWLAKITLLQTRTGRIAAAASLQGTPQSPRMTLQAQAREVTFGKILFHEASLSAAYGASERLAGSLAVSADAGKAMATFDVAAPMLLVKPRFEGWTATLTADVPDPAGLAGRFGNRIKLAIGPLTLHAEAQGTRFDALPGYASVDASVANAASSGPDLLRCTARLQERRWDVRATIDSGNTLIANGALEKRNSLSGTFAVAVKKPGFFSRLLTGEEVIGAVAMSGRLRGDIAGPSATIDISARALSWRGATVERLAATLDYAGNRLHIDTASLTAHGELGTVLPGFGMRTVSGRASIIAEGSGTLERPRASATVAIDNFRAGGLAATSLHARLGYRRDSLFLDDVRLLGGPFAEWRASGMGALLDNDRLLKAALRIQGTAPSETLVVAIACPLIPGPPQTIDRRIADGGRVTVTAPALAVGDFAALLRPGATAAGTLGIDARAVKEGATWELAGSVQGTVRKAADSAAGLSLYGITATADIGGTLAQPLLGATVKADSAVWKGHPFDNLLVRCRGNGAALILDTAEAIVQGSGRLMLAGSARDGSRADSASKRPARRFALARWTCRSLPWDFSAPDVKIEGGTLSAAASLTMA